MLELWEKDDEPGADGGGPGHQVRPGGGRLDTAGAVVGRTNKRTSYAEHVGALPRMECLYAARRLDLVPRIECLDPRIHMRGCVRAARHASVRSICTEPRKEIPVPRNVNEMLEEGLRLDLEIKARQERLKEIKATLAKMAEYKPGTKSGHVIGAKVRAVVVRRESWRLDQAKLAQCAAHLPAEVFGSVFEQICQPIAKARIEEALKRPGSELAKAIQWAGERRISTSVRFEAIRDRQDKAA